MRRLVALILAALAFVQPSAALTPAQELVLFGGGTTYYANLTSGSIPSWLSYASAGVRWCWNATPALVQTAANIPCFDHNPSTGAALGIRSEPQRTNLFLNNLSPAPQTIPVANSATYTISFFGTGTIAWTGACTGSLTGAGATTLAQTSCTTAATSLVITTLTGATAYPQVELNPFATSRILTYGSAVTVPADNWSFTGAALARLKTGRFCAALEFVSEGVPVAEPILLDVGDGTFNNRIFVGLQNASQLDVGVAVGGTYYQNQTAAGASPVGVTTRAAAANNGATKFMSYNGAATTINISGIPLGMNAAILGGVIPTTGNRFSGWFSQIMIRPSCTAAQVQRLSTAGANLQAANDNEWPMFAANDNLPVIVKIASGEW